MEQHYYVYPVESTTFKYVQSGPTIVSENIIADINKQMLDNHKRLIPVNDPTLVLFEPKITQRVLTLVDEKIKEPGYLISYSVVLVNELGNVLATEFEYQNLQTVFTNLQTYINYNNNPGLKNTKYVLRIYASNENVIDAVISDISINTNTSVYGETVDGYYNQIKVSTISYSMS